MVKETINIPFEKIAKKYYALGAMKAMTETIVEGAEVLDFEFSVKDGEGKKVVTYVFTLKNEGGE